MFDADALARAAFRALFGIFAIVTNSTADAESFPSRLNRAAYFAASTKNAAFPVRSSDGHLALLLVDLETGTFKKLVVKGANLLSPYLSSDGTRMLFVRHPDKQQGSELVSCETEGFSCTSVLRSDGSIGFPIEIGSGGILYVSSPYVVGSDGRGRYSRNDFWLLRESSEPQKLTNMQLYQLSSIGVSSDAVYFSGVGPRPDNPAIPPYDPNADSQSDIFKLPFDPVQGRIQDPTQTLQPLFLAAGIARSPSVARDGSVIAYLRTRTDIGNYRYDLIVRNEADHTERRITSTGLGFSRPVVVNGSVYANLIHPDQYWIQVAFPGQQDMKRFVAITDASIDSAGGIELSIKE